MSEFFVITELPSWSNQVDAPGMRGGEQNEAGDGSQGLVVLGCLSRSPSPNSLIGGFLICPSGLFGKFKCSELYEAHFRNWKVLNTFSWHDCERKLGAYRNHKGYVSRQGCLAFVENLYFSPHLIGALLSYLAGRYCPYLTDKNNETREIKCAFS